MSTYLGSISRSRILIAGSILVALAIAWLLPLSAQDRTVTAHFPQAVSIYEGSNVTIMGVAVGRVTEVVPEPDSVKVVMTYSSEYKLPANVKAAIVTPTLVADRFVQFVPAYSSGPALADGADIPVERSVVPVEMDRIYRSVNTLSESLGPQGANKDGALGKVLASTARALDGNGELGQETLKNLSAAARSLGDNSPELFATVESLAGVTETLADNDEDVTRFLADLSEVAEQLAGESDELEDALTAISRAVTTTRVFINETEGILASDLSKLDRTLETILREKESFKTTLELAPLGMTNLALSFDAISNGAGIRLQLTPAVSDLSNLLCGIVTNGGVVGAEAACALFKALIPAITPIDNSVPPGLIPDLPDLPAAAPAGKPGASSPASEPLKVGGIPVGEGALVDQIKKLLTGSP